MLVLGVLVGLFVVVALNNLVSPRRHYLKDGEEETPAPQPVASAEPPPAFMRNDKTRAAKMNEIIDQSRGDFDKLSANDRRFVETMSKGHGREMLRLKAQERLQGLATGSRSASGAGR